ncbi:MAG: alkene reductase, partial [Polyangiaceae bacterium]|nr:alkene reductase [Polyangiaceae bacterium]
EAFAHASKRAIEAGFDGVELHGANGYLIDQFLNVASNHRDDRWGKTTEGRARFAIEAARRASKAIGAERVGIRLSPYGAFNGMTPDDDTDALYLYLAKALAEVGVVYVHLVDHSAMGAPKPKPELVAGIREAFGGTIVLSGGYDGARAESDLAAKKGELVAFGRPFLSNPDLTKRLREGLALAVPDMSTCYTPGENGYTDCPASE